MEEVVKTTCGMCEIACGIEAIKENGKLVKIQGMQEHVMNTPCLKGKQAPAYLEDNKRIKKPLKKVNGVFQEISWEEAIALMAEKLNFLKKEYGAHSLGIFMGSKQTLRDSVYYARRFGDVFGTPNFMSGASYCAYPKIIGDVLTLGEFVYPSYNGTKCIVLWGTNPLASSLPGNMAVHRAIQRKAKLLVVDPRKTKLAKQADVHAQLRPGTDSAFALSVLNVIIEEELYDKKFVAEWTIGFEQFAVHVKQYSPEAMEKVTDVPAETTKKFARLYAKTQPAAILQGLSLDACTNGTQAIRAVAILIAICGNFDVPGGNTYQPKHPLYGGFGLKERLPSDVKPFSAEMYPAFHEIVSERGPSHCETSNSPLADTILSGKPYPIKGLLVCAANPVLTWPNALHVKEALRSLDFLVVIDPKMTETAELADLVLPSTTFLEQDMLSIYYPTLPLVTYHQKVIDPLWDSWPDWKIWFKLARAMGYTEEFPWSDVCEAFEEMLKPMNITLAQLREDPRGVFTGSRMLVKRYRKEGFHTPSGKVEIYSEKLLNWGYDPLPVYREPEESPFSTPELADEYPYILTTGARVYEYVHSQHRGIAALNQRVPFPEAELHPTIAATSGIKSGDDIYIESPRGRIKMKAKVTLDIHHRTISVPHGWPGEANANILTDDSKRDPISGDTDYRSCLCKIYKAED